MNSNEILTLQLGNYANHVGAHWWNIQETSFDYKTPSQVNHDVLYREGLTLQNQPTFTPRLLLVDLEGSLQALRYDDLYQEEQEIEPVQEPQHHEVIEQDKIEPVPFQVDLAKGIDVFAKRYDFESDVRAWSDYLYTRFHPRTIHIVNEYKHQSKEQPFDCYPQGGDVWNSYNFNEEFIDRIRQYVEECDYLQGFQVLFDVHNGFSGLAASCLEYLQDEYKKTTLAFPLLSESTNKDVDNLNLCFAYDNLMENSTLFVPLSAASSKFPYVNQQSELFYHTSAVLATFLDTFTLNYRLKTCDGGTLQQICCELNRGGRKAAAASVNFPLFSEQHFIDYLDKHEGALTQNLSPDCELNQDSCIQSLVLRGVKEDALKTEKHYTLPAFKCSTPQEMLSFYMDCTCFGSKTTVLSTEAKMKTKTPFPKFFKEHFENAEAVNVLAGLHNGKFVGNIFDTLASKVEKIDYNKHHQFNKSLHKDELNECLSHILDLADCYKDNQLI